jgi:hypothetical protein
MEVVFGCTNTQLTGPVADGMCIRQVFISQAEMLDSVSIFFSTYKRKNEGIIVVDLIEFMSEKKIFTTQCKASELIDNDWYLFKFGVPMGFRQKYELRLWTKSCRAGQTFTAHCGTKKNWGFLFRGARLIRESELKCRFIYSGKKW